MNILHHSMKKLAMLCAASLFALHAAADDFEIDGICYTCDDLSSSTTCSVTSGGNYTGNVVIHETVIYEGRTMTVAAIGDSAFYFCDSLTEINIPGSVTTIGGFAFSGCTSLTEINIPESVTYIGNYAFYDCSSLTEIIIPESVTSIGDGAFADCYSLMEITIPESVTTIEDEVFRNCHSLTEITIPESVTSIGDWAFYYCFSLTEINIPESVTSIGSGAFGGCGFTEINIPESVTSIGDWAFMLCYSLTEITIPESVTSIGMYAFEHCYSLAEITIPESVTSIGTQAFFYCSGITAVYSWNPEPPTYSSSGNDSCFSENVYEDATLYVPTGSLSAYRTADEWKHFQTIVETDGTETGIAGTQADTRTEVYAGNGHITVSGVTGIVRVYDMSGTLLRSARSDGSRLELALPSGRIYIVEAGGQATKVAL